MVSAPVLASAVLIVLGAFVFPQALGEDNDCDYKNYDVKLYEVSNCSDSSNLPVYVTDVSLKRTGPTTYRADAAVVVTEDVADGIQMTFSIKKCPSADDRNGCVTLLKVDENEFCKCLADKEAYWAHLIDCMKDFDPKCPVKAGAFHIINYEVQLCEFPAMDNPDGYYVVEVDVRQPGPPPKSITCMNLEMGLVAKAD